MVDSNHVFKFVGSNLRYLVLFKHSNLFTIVSEDGNVEEIGTSHLLSIEESSITPFNPDNDEDFYQFIHQSSEYN